MYAPKIYREARKSKLGTFFFFVKLQEKIVTCIDSNEYSLKLTFRQKSIQNHEISFIAPEFKEKKKNSRNYE